MAGLAPGWPCRLMIVGAVREQLHDQLALRLAALDVVGADMGEDARNLVDAAVDGDDRDAGVDRFLQRPAPWRRPRCGLMTMPSTPWVIAASMSAVCLGDDTWPSLSITVMPPSFSASAFIWFIMWTKNGKVSPGTDSMIVRGLSSACAGLQGPERDADGADQRQCLFHHLFSPPPERTATLV